MCAKKLKTNKNYYFSVEGDTEGWYLDYLQKLINNCSKATCTVKLKHKKLMPTRYAKTLANITEEEQPIWHGRGTEAGKHPRLLRENHRGQKRAENEGLHDYCALREPDSGTGPR